MPLLPGDSTASVVLLSAIGVALVAIMFLYLRTSDPLQFRKRSTSLGWFIPAMCVTSALPYFGVFSPAPVILVLGIYFTGLGKSQTLALAVYAVCAGAQGVLAALVITRAIPDTGIVQLLPLGVAEQWIVQGLVQVVLLGTYVTARVSRRTALAAVGELERAVRLAAHREALLLEAREELERALRSGRGRFTEQTLGGYQLGVVIGRGAMGEVYAATDGSGREVAIKLLSQASLGNANHVLRFLRELRTAAGLDAPNVVRVLDVGEQPVPYLVMERLEGQTLAEVLRAQRALPPAEVVELVRQVGAGITAAAAAGIVHRDLKPQNVFLHHRTWKVLDFGVARAIDHGDTLTAGHVVGTPSYMAPEQASGATVDHRTDLYALAAIAYRALTGHPPFAAGAIAETLYKVVHTQPRRPSELAELPERRRPRARDRPRQAAARSVRLGARARRRPGRGARRRAARPAARARRRPGARRRLGAAPGPTVDRPDPRPALRTWSNRHVRCNGQGIARARADHRETGPTMDMTEPPAAASRSERASILARLEDWLERPMIGLGLAWLLLLVVELAWGLTARLQLVVSAIWGIFIADFLLRLWLAERRVPYLRRNWLTIIALAVPALRVLRIGRLAMVFRSARAARGIMFTRVVTTMNRARRNVHTALARRHGFGYVLGLTLVVALVGAAGMLAFERGAAREFEGYLHALWWTAMLLSTMGSEHWPLTAEGRSLTLILSIYGFAIFGYITATIASWLVGRDQAIAATRGKKPSAGKRANTAPGG